MRVDASADLSVTAVVAALPEEVAPLRSQLKGIERRRVGALQIESGRLGGRRIVVAVTGDGERNARAGVAALLAASRAEQLIAIGVAGALSGGLATASLVVASQVTDAGGRAVVGDEQQVAVVARATGGRMAVVLSAAAIVDRAEEKQRLAREIAPGDGAAVVDLESASYVAGAVAAGIPWLVLRAVSDTADESLPALLNQSRDEGGAVRRARVVLGLLRQPETFAFLLSLRGRVGRCADVLARAVAAALPALAAARRGP